MTEGENGREFVIMAILIFPSGLHARDTWQEYPDPIVSGFCDVPYFRFFFFPLTSFVPLSSRFGDTECAAGREALGILGHHYRHLEGKFGPSAGYIIP